MLLPLIEVCRGTLPLIVAQMSAMVLQRMISAMGCVQVFNPPYVPTPDEEVLRTGIAQAWAGGYRGRVIIDRFLPLVRFLNLSFAPSEM